MEHQLTAYDIEFMRWLNSKEGEPHWEKDDKGEKTMILRAGWAQAQLEYDRKKELYEYDNQK